MYSVPVDWGQTLDARVIANPVASDISFSGIGVTVLDPRYVADYADRGSRLSLLQRKGHCDRGVRTGSLSQPDRR